MYFFVWFVYVAKCLPPALRNVIRLWHNIRSIFVLKMPLNTNQPSPLPVTIYIVEREVLCRVTQLGWLVEVSNRHRFDGDLLITRRAADMLANGNEF